MNGDEIDHDDITCHFDTVTTTSNCKFITTLDRQRHHSPTELLTSMGTATATSSL
jgi:hypothetical protein